MIALKKENLRKDIKAHILFLSNDTSSVSFTLKAK